ncbi:hypothetical protein BJ875DRAFT_460621 [Amylocarpus encephaloides]|uniref:Uncharacterized protein n=1 Tax=Amylocarpus encephaloides TaxID=45428 RepID=A0A9P7YJH0_9HELO|nr:hypothetical protein BJ875DRAFT_460621 [Amylocarpus encephaloides]
MPPLRFLSFSFPSESFPIQVPTRERNHGSDSPWSHSGWPSAACRPKPAPAAGGGACSQVGVKGWWWTSPYVLVVVLAFRMGRRRFGMCRAMRAALVGGSGCWILFSQWQLLLVTISVIRMGTPPP